ncbi:phosphopantetheine-binding protein [Pasteurellaceae bacterium LIM206]|nr:phosphopantetheine-binding protein [Pasteurellaceae bacterium LIM206]
MENLEHELKQLIIDTLNLEDMSADDIETEVALFGEELGLDSVDALELGLAIQKKYQFQLDTQHQDLKENFYSIATLAKYITAQQA